MLKPSLIETQFLISIRQHTPSFRDVFEGSFGTESFVLIWVQHESELSVLLSDGVLICPKIHLQDCVAI